MVKFFILLYLAKSPSPEPPQPSPEPEPAETPPTPPPEKPGLPPPRKDLEFLAEMERERLAEERRLKSFRLFEKMKKRVSFPKVKMDDITCVEECKLIKIKHVCVFI